VARLGGDEFVLVSVGTDADAARHLGARIVDAVGRPFDEDPGIMVGASIGIALSDNGRAGAEALLRGADMAMYRRKQAGRGRTGCRRRRGRRGPPPGDGRPLIAVRPPCGP
jgi:diguanylate cyclase (GGDEF)-like protein